MNASVFDQFFQGLALDRLNRAIDLALDEDGRDLTSLALFQTNDAAQAEIVAKQDLVASGLPLAAMVLGRVDPGGDWNVDLKARDGQALAPGDVAAVLSGSARTLLAAERIILNFVCHMSGIATLVHACVQALGDSKTRLLDTRKTLPGLRYPEKYAVLCGGGMNHRLSLEDMLMLKDNHIDRAGGIEKAVAAARAAYSPCPPLEVECRDLAEVSQAVAAGADRIMFDNMTPALVSQALEITPPGIETEISGGVTRGNLAELGRLGADFISMGRLTHSAPAADFSMRMIVKK